MEWNATMQYRNLGRSGLRVSLVGLGCNNFGGRIDLEAARVKKIDSPVAGRANVLIVPDLEAGNMLAKQLSFISHAEGAGLVLGAIVLMFRQQILGFVTVATGQTIWDPTMRYLTELPSKPDPVEIAAIVVMALVFSFLATLYPAFKAASTDPVQVLRYE